MFECQSCKDYRKCAFKTGKDFYHYGEIRFCPYQIIWLILHWGILEAGNWPPELNGSSYSDLGMKSRLKPEAYYTKPEEILAELELRLETTGAAGEALIDEVKQGLSFEQLSRPAKRALLYVKGWRRKKTSFSTWGKQVKYRQRVI